LTRTTKKEVAKGTRTFPRVANRSEASGEKATATSESEWFSHTSRLCKEFARKRYTNPVEVPAITFDTNKHARNTGA